MKPVITLLCLLAFLFTPLTSQATRPVSPPPVTSTGKVTLNLRNVDIRSLIDTVSKATGVNFVIDPRVRGNVTVVSSTPMDRKALYQVFLSILDVYGYSAVPSGNVVKIIPSINARTSALLKGHGEEFVTRVVQVHNVPVAQIVPMLRPLIPRQGFLAAYPPNNMLIVTDRASNVARITRLIHELDRPDNSQIELIHLKNASASEVGRLLNKLQNQATTRGGGASRARIVADIRSNSLLISGNQATRQRLRALVEQLDTPLPSAGNSHVIFLRYAKAEDIAKILQKIVSNAKQVQTKNKSAPQGPVNVQADSTNNALIITGPANKVRDLRQVVRQLDIRPAEVLIDAIIAEVSGNLAKKLGAQIGVLPNRATKEGPAGLINFSNGSIPLTSLAAGPAALAAAGPGLLFGFGRASVHGSRYGLLLNALSSNSATNILSTPSILTLDNKAAEIVVGQDVPFVTGSYSSTGTGLNMGSQRPGGISSGFGGSGGLVSSPFQTIERKKVGIILKVTPQINEGNSVRLKLDLTVSSLAPSIQGAADLITNTRQIKTVVITNSNSIIVLGGLIEDSYKNSVQKVPLLGDIPILGRLFRSTSRTRTKTNLMIFLHPVILNNQALANAYTEEKYRIMRAQQLYHSLQQKNGGEQNTGTGPTLPKSLRQLSPSPPASVLTPAAGRSVSAPPQAVPSPNAKSVAAPSASPQPNVDKHGSRPDNR